MSRICSVCLKGPRIGYLISHAKNATKRWVYPNVHTMRFIHREKSPGKVQRAKVCTKCVKAGKVEKVI